MLGQESTAAVLCWPFTVLSTLHINTFSWEGGEGSGITHTLQIRKQTLKLLPASEWRSQDDLSPRLASKTVFLL